MKAASGRSRVVYVNTFGRHRCGSVIRYSGGGGGGGHLRPPEKGAPADPASSCPGGASPPAAVSDRRGSRRAAAALSPREEGKKSPCLGLGAPRGARAKGPGIRRKRRPRDGGGEAKGPKARRPVVKAASSPHEARSGERVAANSTGPSSQEEAGGCEETQGDAFEFPSSCEDDNSEIRHQKKKSTVWLGVCKVISKMIEENGHFRSRLMSYSELPSEGRDVNGNIQNETSCIDTDEAIFGWV